MKFITESEIIEKYKKDKFDSFVQPENTRLTPGARQWLIDRNLIDQKNNPKETPVTYENYFQKKENHAKNNDLRIFFELLKTEFFSARYILLKLNKNVAEKINKYSGLIYKIYEGKDIREELDFEECTGIKPDNFSGDLGVCFKIDSLNANCNRGEELIILHLLRIKIYLLIEKVLENKIKNHAGVLQGLYMLINTLSKMICEASGSKVCKR
ncbi:MAG: hypothetical protein LBD41_07140 [Clostridiales Family XIII bacterium]|jgi:hypothetical protein|nr:hypothetical protein [Clostridiales Family XIII bacterium]